MEWGCTGETDFRTTWTRPGSGRDRRDEADAGAGLSELGSGAKLLLQTRAGGAGLGGRTVSACRGVRRLGSSGFCEAPAEGIFPWAVSSGGVFRFSGHPLLSDGRGILFLQDSLGVGEHGWAGGRLVVTQESSLLRQFFMCQRLFWRTAALDYPALMLSFLIFMKVPSLPLGLLEKSSLRSSLSTSKQ